MAEEFDHLDDNERLKAENDFLKMKLMLEKGASFGNMDSGMELPAGIENKFLNYILEFEKQAENPAKIKVFDKIGQPLHFKRVIEIPDQEIEDAYTNLLTYLATYRIHFDVCSPNITVRELYRFVTEELFEHEMSDINIPGATSNFIYDEFYPDPVYENSNVAVDECINYILKKEPITWTHHFRDENIRLNDHFPLSIEQFKLLPNNYKSAYEEIVIDDITVLNCLVEAIDCCVNGTYRLTAETGNDQIQLSGNWEVHFEKDAELGYWYIYEVKIEGIQFQ